MNNSPACHSLHMPTTSWLVLYVYAATANLGIVRAQGKESGIFASMLWDMLSWLLRSKIQSQVDSGLLWSLTLKGGGRIATWHSRRDPQKPRFTSGLRFSDYEVRSWPPESMFGHDWLNYAFQESSSSWLWRQIDNGSGFFWIRGKELIFSRANLDLIWTIREINLKLRK